MVFHHFYMSSGIQIFNLTEKAGGQETKFLVSCDGRCHNVKIVLHVVKGDLDLFGLESSTPIIYDNKCSACNSFCSSRKNDRSTEICNNLGTTGNNIHVMVFWYKDGTGTITFENIDRVVQYGK